MVKKTSGFLILDLLVAVMIAGLAISMAMKFPVTLVNFWKIVSVRSHRDIDSTRVLVFLEKDFATIFLPTNYAPEPKVDTSLTPSGPGALSQDKTLVTKDNQDNKSEEEKRFYFTVVTQNDILDYFFFINTNPFEVYSYSKPRITGVIYKLEKLGVLTNSQDVMNNGNAQQVSYKLFRYEIEDYESLIGKKIDFGLISEQRNLVLDNIASFSLKMEYVVPKKQNSAPLAGISKGASQDNKIVQEQDASDNFEVKTTVNWPVEGVGVDVLPHKVSLTCTFLANDNRSAFSKEILLFSSYQLKDDKPLPKTSLNNTST